MIVVQQKTQKGFNKYDEWFEPTDDWDEGTLGLKNKKV